MVDKIIVWLESELIKCRGILSLIRSSSNIWLLKIVRRVVRASWNAKACPILEAAPSFSQRKIAIQSW